MKFHLAEALGCACMICHEMWWIGRRTTKITLAVVCERFCRPSFVPTIFIKIVVNIEPDGATLTHTHTHKIECSLSTIHIGATPPGPKIYFRHLTFGAMSWLAKGAEERARTQIFTYCALISDAYYVYADRVCITVYACARVRQINTSISICWLWNWKNGLWMAKA